jgi:hypothetical protein
MARAGEASGAELLFSEYDEVLSLDHVDHPGVANAQPQEPLWALELLDTSRPGIVLETFDASNNPSLDIPGKPGQFLVSGPEELDRVGHARGSPPQTLLDAGEWDPRLVPRVGERLPGRVDI